MKIRKASKKKSKHKAKQTRSYQMMLGASLFFARNNFFITQANTEEDDHREVLTIKAIRFKPIHF